MKAGIHPKPHLTKVKCTCGNEFTTHSVLPEIHVEVCSSCHPFYTGQKKNLDRGGMVERFKKKYGINK